MFKLIWCVDANGCILPIVVSLYGIACSLCSKLMCIVTRTILWHQEGNFGTHACICWMIIAWAHQIWWREIENSCKVTVLLKVISLMLWIPYFPTRNVLLEKNWIFSKRVFRSRFFSSRFSWPFKDLKDSTPKITVCVVHLSFMGKAVHFYGLISRLMVCLSSKKCIVAMFSCFKKSEKVLLRKVYLLAWCLMLNWLRKHSFICAAKTWNLCFFYSFWKVFIEKHVKKIIKVMKNGNSLRQEKVQVIMYHVIEHFISSLADNKNELPKNEQYFYFSFCRRYRDFP